MTIPRRKSFHRKEKWKVLEGFDGRYFISNKGRIKADQTITYHTTIKAKIIKPFFLGEDHLSPYVKLSKINPETKKFESRLYNLKNLVGKHWINEYDPNVPVVFRNKKTPWDCSIFNIRQKSKRTAVLTENMVREIKQELKEHGHEKGFRAHLARKYDVDWATIWKIDKGRAWSHIQPAEANSSGKQ